MKLFKGMALTAMALTLVAGAFTASPAANAATQLSGSITINGSSALLPLTQQAAVEFKKLNPKVKIAASSAGSITGPQSVRKGIADIGAIDWDATKDVPGFKKFDGQVAYKVAITIFAAIANPSAKVDSLTSQQLQDIFSGKIKNWKEVGGADQNIVVVNRNFGSGTRVNFQMKALNNVDFLTTGNVKSAGSSGEMKTNVESTPGAIGYIDLPYVTAKMTALKIDGVAPTAENVTNGKYKVWGFGYYMTKGEATGATKAFIDYIQSPTFQNGSLKKLKFLPISAMK